MSHDRCVALLTSKAAMFGPDVIVRQPTMDLFLDVEEMLQAAGEGELRKSVTSDVFCEVQRLLRKRRREPAS